MEDSWIDYSKNSDIGIYIYYTNNRVEWDRWKDVDNSFKIHFNRPNYKIATINNLIGSDSKYVKQLKWE